MRKLLVAVIAAAALFAVGAFAASFAVQSEDIASGANSVEACATHVDIDFDDPATNAGGEWTVDGATIRFYSNVAGAPEDLTTNCAGYSAQMAVVAGTVVESGEATVGVGQSSVHLDFAATIAEDIDSASVVVDGKNFTIDVTP